MSISKTQLSKLYKPFVEGITLAATAVREAEEKVTLTRTMLGREVGKAVATLTGGGASVEEAQALIMETIDKVAPNLVDWKTVQGWVRASVVEDSLPEELREVYSTQALQEIGKIAEEPKNGGKSRVDFAQEMAKSGKTSVRELRTAVRDEKDSSGGAEKTAASKATQAAKAVEIGKKHLKDHPLPTDPGADFTATFVALFELGVAVGKKATSFRKDAYNAAGEELITDWLVETGQIQVADVDDAEKAAELVSA